MSESGGSRPSLPWLRMFAEGVAIVVSILLAFAIDAWWNDRLERLEVSSVVHGLREEFQGYVSILEADVGRSDVSLRHLSYLFVDSGNPYGDLPPDSLDAAFWTLLRAPTWDQGSGVRDALVSSGRLESLRSEELRSSLAAWPGVVEELRDNQLAVRTYVLEILVPFLSDRGVPLVRVLPIRFHPEAPSEASIRPRAPDLTSETVEVYRRTISDPEFQSLLAYRHYWEVSSSREYRDVLAAANDILFMLRAEMED